MDQKAIVEFYDSFVEAQKQSGINERVYGLFMRLKDLGLHSGSNVLELGCGIGTMTWLISGIVKTGSIEAVDLSPASIDFATSKIRKNNTRFLVGDIVRYQPSLPQPDFITLFDIIEHIPSEHHQELFENIAAYSSEKTMILINIPSPMSVEYDREHNPTSLQVIDQPLSLRHLMNVMEQAGLTLLHFETYSVWVKYDYQFLIVSKTISYDGALLNSKMGLFQKMSGRIRRSWRKLVYRYP